MPSALARDLCGERMKGLMDVFSSSLSILKEKQVGTSSIIAEMANKKDCLKKKVAWMLGRQRRMAHDKNKWWE